MTEFFDVNRQAVEKYAGHLLGIFDTLPHPPPAIKTKTGKCSVKIGGISIAGSVDPDAEGRKFAEKYSNASSGLLVYGFGLGYHLEALLDGSQSGCITVLEANSEILSAAFHHRDLTGIFCDKRFTLVTGKNDEELAANLLEILDVSSEDWNIAIHTPSYRCLPERFVKLKNVFETLRTERRFKAYFGEQEKMNIMANLNAISGSPGVSTLFDGWKERPAILVGAGPSLDRNLPLLDLLSKKAFILAVDSASSVLSDAGISCHVVISIDPQPSSVYHFGRDAVAPLIFFPATHPWVVKKFSGRRFAAIKESHSLFRKAEHLVMDRGVSEAGGSVSCVGLDILVKTGANPIGIIGQDFAFPKGVPYNRATFSGIMPDEPAMRRDYPAVRDMVNVYENLKIDSVEGHSIITHANLLSYLKNFESIILKNPDRNFCNINSSGASINGCRNVAGAGEILRVFGVQGVLPTQPHLPEATPNPELANKLRELLFNA